MFSTTRALRQAAVHAERTPLIRFVGPRTVPSNIDHSAKPHPAAPTGKLPENFQAGTAHSSFSSYRDHAQQHGPLQRTIRSEGGIGGTAGAHMGSVAPPQGVFFDVSELPNRFHRQHLSAAEIEAIESGGAA